MGKATKVRNARRHWCAEDDNAVRLNYGRLSTAQIARRIGRSEKAVYLRALMLKSGPSAKDLRERAPSRRGESTWFARGHRPTNALPIGAEVLTENGYLKRKVRDGAPVGYARRNWEFVHLIVWREHYGAVPHGHAVVFRNSDKTDLRIENLALISRRELMARNTVQRFPIDLRKAMHLKGLLTRKIDHMERRHEESN